MDYRIFYTSSSSIFLWSHKLDLVQDGSFAAQGIPAGAWEKEDSQFIQGLEMARGLRFGTARGTINLVTTTESLP